MKPAAGLSDPASVPDAALVETPRHQGLYVPSSVAQGPQEASPDSSERHPESASKEEDRESIEEPAKIMRIGAMVRQLLEEVRNTTLDEASRKRLREIYEQSLRELAGTLSPDLAEELGRMTLPFDSEAPSDAELRIAQAQLVGWLEGLFHGIQAAVFAQQIAAQAQLDQMRRRGLPPPVRPGPSEAAESMPGTYL